MTEPEKDKGGAPFGNQNAAKSPNPILLRLRRGLPVPPEITYALKAADRETAPLFDHCGGAENCSETQSRLIANYGNLEQLKFIIWQQAYKKGAIQVEPETGDWDLSKGLTRIITIVNSQNKILQLLGLKREARNVNELNALFETVDEPTEESEPGQTEAQEHASTSPTEQEKKPDVKSDFT